MNLCFRVLEEQRVILLGTQCALQFYFEDTCPDLMMISMTEMSGKVRIVSTVAATIVSTMGLHRQLYRLERIR